LYGIFLPYGVTDMDFNDLSVSGLRINYQVVTGSEVVFDLQTQAITIPDGLTLNLKIRILEKSC
jgi:hypothetical protein